MPPLNGLRAFECAARHLSFKLAAHEMSVTPGAVSQQVKHLEQAMGVPLFQRRHRSLVLTGHGEALLPAVSEAFEILSAAGDTVARNLKTRPLRLGVSPRLAPDPTKLLAQLARRRKAPEFLRIEATDEVADLIGGKLDALLRPGPGPYPGMHAERITLPSDFAPHRQAWLVVWPGLAHCRELVKAKALLSGP